MAFNLTAQLNVALNTASLRNAANTINSQLKDVGAVSLGIPKSDADSLKNIKLQAFEASNAMEQFGRQSGLAAKRFVAFTITAGAIIQFTSSLRNALSAAVEFDREVVRLAQVSSDGATEVSKVSSEVSRLATSYGVSSKELINTAVTLKQANLTLKETKDALEALAQAALAPSFDNLRDTTEGAIAIMNQFNISARDLGGALGSVNAVAAEFAVEAQDLIEGVRKAGGAFKSAGGDLNEFLALFTSIRQTTRESAESIGTGLRTIFTRIQRNDTVEALKEIGVQLRYTADEAKAAGDLGLTNQFVGPYEAVKRLSAALNELRSTDPRFSAIVEELGGYRQISKVIPLIQEFAVSQKALGVAQAGSVSLAQNAAQAQEAFGVKIQKVAEQFNALVRDLTNTSSFRALVDILLGGASAAIKLADSLKEIIPILTAIAAVKVAQSITSFTKGFASTAFAPAPANQPNVFSPFLPNVNKKAYGGILRMARGGVVPGSGRGDKVPALLEPGELVIPRQKFAEGKYVEAAQLKSPTMISKIYDPDKAITEKDYDNGKYINSKDKIYFSQRIIPIQGSSQATKDKTGAIFEKEAAQILGGVLTKATFAVDIIGKGNYPYEVKNVQETIPDAQIADKLARYKNILSPRFFRNKIESGDEINLGEIGVVYNTKKLSKEDLQDKFGKENIQKIEDAKKRNEGGVELSQRLKRKALGLAYGGLVPGTGNTDSVPLDLPIGSYVIKKSSVNSIGASNLSRLGRAKGGTIPALVMPGEYIYSPDETKNIGVSNLDYMNTTGRKRFAGGGYNDLTKKEKNIAMQIERQLRIPSSEKDKEQNVNETLGIIEDMQDSNKEIKIQQKELRKLTKLIKAEQVAVEGAKKDLETLKAAAKADSAVANRIVSAQNKRETELRKIVSSIKADDLVKNTLESNKLKAASVGDDKEVRRINKQLLSLERERLSKTAKAKVIQDEINSQQRNVQIATKQAATSTKAVADKEQQIEQGMQNVSDLKKQKVEQKKQLQKLKDEGFSIDKEGLVTKGGKVITSKFKSEKNAPTYKELVKERIDQYTKTYGEAPTGETRKALRSNLAGELRQSYFDQLKQLADQQGLNFNEEFASAQSKQMTREAIAGRRQIIKNEQGNYIDPNLQRQMEKRQQDAEKLRKSTFLGRWFGIGPEEPIPPRPGSNVPPEKGTLGNRIVGGAKKAFGYLKENAGLVAGIGLGYAGSLAAPGDISNYKGRENQYTQESYASGLFTGAGTGAALGGATGNPIAAVVGGLIGGVIGVIAGLKQAKQDIARIKVEESLDNLKTAFESASSDLGRASAASVTAIINAQKELDKSIVAKAEANKGFFSSGPDIGTLLSERKTSYATQAPQINAFLSREIEQGIKTNANFNIKDFFNEGVVADQLSRLATGLGKPIEDVKKQFEKFAVDVARQNDILNRQKEGVKAEQQLLTSLSGLADASTQAANSLNNLNPKFQIASDMLSNTTNISPIRRRSTDIESMSFNPKSFNNIVAETASGLGVFGKEFEKQGNIVGTISSVLPNILSNINTKNTEPGKDPASQLREGLRDALKGQKQEDISRYVNLIVGKMGEDFGKMLNEAGGDFGELAKRLEAPLKDPFIKALKEITSGFEKAADVYAEGLNRLAQASINTAAEMEKLSRLKMEGVLLDKQNQINKEFDKRAGNLNNLRFGDNFVNKDIISLETISIKDQMQAFNEFQNQLTKTKDNPAGLVEGKQLDPKAIQDLILQNQKNQEAKQQEINKAQIGTEAYRAPMEELSRLKTEANLLNSALKNLANSTEELSATQNRINTIEKLIADEREKNVRRQQQVEQTGERLLTSNPEQIQRFQAGAQLTNIAERFAGGNLLKFNVEQRKAIFEYLDMMGDQGQQRKSMLLQRTGFVAPQDKTIQNRFGGELDQLRNRLLEINRVQQQAQLFIIQNQKNLQDQFFNELKAQARDFFNNLKANQNALLLGQAQEQERQANARVKDFQGGQEAANLFQGVGKQTFDDFRKNQQAALSFIDAQKKVADIEQYAKKDIEIVKPQIAGRGQIAPIEIIKYSDKLKDLAKGIFERAKVGSGGDELKKVDILTREISSIKNLNANPLDVLVRANQVGGGAITQESLTAALNEAFRSQLESQQSILKNNAPKLGFQEKDGKFVAKENNQLAALINNLINSGKTTEAISKSIETIKNLGIVIGEGFEPQLQALQAAALNATARVNQLNKGINQIGLQNPQVKPEQPIVNQLPRASGGPIGHGSMVRGSASSLFTPKGTDTVPAILTPGEYVINAAATSKNYGLLEAINSGKPLQFNEGGFVQYLQAGGQPDVKVPENREEQIRQIKRHNFLVKQVFSFARYRQKLRNDAYNNSLNLLSGGYPNSYKHYRDTGELAFVALSNVEPFTAFDRDYEGFKKIFPNFSKGAYKSYQKLSAQGRTFPYLMPRTIKTMDAIEVYSIFDKRYANPEKINFDEVFRKLLLFNIKYNDVPNSPLGFSEGGVIGNIFTSGRYDLQKYPNELPKISSKYLSPSKFPLLDPSSFGQTGETVFWNEFLTNNSDNETTKNSRFGEFISGRLKKYKPADPLENYKPTADVDLGGLPIRFSSLRDEKGRLMLDDQGQPIVKKYFESEYALTQRIRDLVLKQEDLQKTIEDLTVEDLSQKNKTFTFKYSKLKTEKNPGYNKQINYVGEKSRDTYIKWLKSKAPEAKWSSMINTIHGLNRYKYDEKNIDDRPYLYSIEDLEEQVSYQPRILKSELGLLRTQQNLGKIPLRDEQGKSYLKGNIIESLLNKDALNLYKDFEKDYVDQKLLEWKSLQDFATQHKEILQLPVELPNKTKQDFKPLNINIFKEAFRQNVGEYLYLKEQFKDGKLSGKYLTDFYGADAADINKMFPQKYRIIPDDLRKDQEDILNNLGVSPNNKSAKDIASILKLERMGKIKWPDYTDPFSDTEETVVSELLPFIQKSKAFSDNLKFNAIKEAQDILKNVKQPEEPKKEKPKERFKATELEKTKFSESAKIFRLAGLEIEKTLIGENIDQYIFSDIDLENKENLKKEAFNRIPYLRGEAKRFNKNLNPQISVLENYIKELKFGRYIGGSEEQAGRILNNVAEQAIALRMAKPQEQAAQQKPNLNKELFKNNVDNLISTLGNKYRTYYYGGEALYSNVESGVIDLLNAFGNGRQLPLKDWSEAAKKPFDNNYKELISQRFLPLPEELTKNFDPDQIDNKARLSFLNRIAKYYDQTSNIYKSVLPLLESGASPDFIQKSFDLIKAESLTLANDIGTFTEPIRRQVVQKLKNAGAIGFNSGGIVPNSAPNPDPSFFKSRGTDTVPAMLSPGEYVVNARATAQHLPLLQSLNKGGPVYARNGGVRFIDPNYAYQNRLSPGLGMTPSSSYKSGMAKWNNGFSSAPITWYKPGRTFDVGLQGYEAIRTFNPESQRQTTNNIGSYIGDRLGQRKSFQINLDKASLEAYGLSGDYGTYSQSGFPNADLYSGLTLLNAINPMMAGAVKFAAERAIWNDILYNKEINTAPGAPLLGGPPGSAQFPKRSLQDYVSLGFGRTLGANAQAAISQGFLSDAVGAEGQVSAIRSSLASIQDAKDLGSVSVNNTEREMAKVNAIIQQAYKDSASDTYSPYLPPSYNGSSGNPLGGMVAGTNAFLNSPSGSTYGSYQNQRGFNQPHPFLRNFFADGGAIGTDRIPAMLTPGEYVLRKEAVNKVGTSFLDKINRYATGGLVNYYQTGTRGGTSSGSLNMGNIAANISSALNFNLSPLQDASKVFNSAAQVLSPALSGLSPILTSFQSSLGLANSSLSQTVNILSSATSGMRDSGISFQQAANILSQAITSIPKTITLQSSPALVSVDFNTASVVQAIQNALSNMQNTLFAGLGNLINNKLNDQMRNA